MKILHIAAIGLNAEGIGTVISKIVPEQIALGNDVRIISTCKNLIYKSLPITHITESDNFRQYLKEWKPDIVQFHSVYRFPFVRFYKVLLKADIPYVIQMHGALSVENFKKSNLKKRVANLLFFNSYMRNAKAGIFLNHEELENCVVRELYPFTMILPNGCDHVEKIEIKDNVKDPVDIIFLGRVFMVHKGLDVLCDAIDILMKEYDNSFTISFYANPDDEDLPILKNRIEQYTDIISYKGGVYGAEKDQRLRDADIFILTSRFEGMPMGLLEALSYGIPSIVTPGTNMSSIISNAGAGWISEFDAKSIAIGIKEAVKDMRINPKLFHQNAYKLGLSFNWKEIAKQSIDIYKRVLK